MKISNQWGIIWDTGAYLGMVSLKTFLEKFLDEETVNYIDYVSDDAAHKIATRGESEVFLGRISQIIKDAS